MDYTQNLNLPQFAETDRIHHDDFNDAFQAIDAGMPRIVTGSYVGDDTAERTINLGKRPKFVFVWAAERSYLGNDRWTYWGIATDAGVQKLEGVSTVELTDTGFRVFRHGDNLYNAITNSSGYTYAYIALL